MKTDGKYISRAALLEHLARCKRSEDATTLTASVIAALQCFIQSQPAADVAEVVRCRACKYRVDATINANGFLICDISDMEIAPDDFCSYGEYQTNTGGNGNVSD